ncbi:MAG: hypothetical protein KKF46_04150 [Nanoarchaeota archaeon]|nr:hypothetical protein [Nanoarchaeota archaeon]MBU1321527.1 hypothetical protein [Nanoarchaeota archaeon]MBU1597163.1 hypothetical protein [Nanoarchaeota archaeon]MBU2441152.1 hypothetical protein [Nanoarchaeota archaeon]
MQETELIPTQNEVRTWLLTTLKHSFHVEYFLDKLGLGSKDPERPHDLVGFGNKFEWDVIKGFALALREPKVDFEKYISPSRELHRQQYHHRKWNNPNPEDITKPIRGASREDMFVGAVDATCSLLENRSYQGGNHDYDEITRLASKNPPHRTHWMLKIIPDMREIKQPELFLIDNLADFPNIGVPVDLYKAIKSRTAETLEMLKRDYDYIIVE